MSERNKLKEAQNLLKQGGHLEAKKIVEEIKTLDPAIRLDVIMLLLVVYDHVRENDKLLLATDEGIKIATMLGNDPVRTYLVGRKAIFLTSALSHMVHREKNLVLSSNVFGWIDFSLERDKKEYEAIIEKRAVLEKEIATLVTEVIEKTEESSDHYFRGSTLSAIGDFYSSIYFCYLLDFQSGGKIKSKIANMYFVRRWNIIFFLYDKVSRRKILESKKKCFQYFERSIEEFRLGEYQSEEAHAMYNLAVKLKLTNHFQRAHKLLAKAKTIAKELRETHLLAQIEALEEETAKKNRHIRDYVSELGLDLP
ncbi:MAG: hypothetical protein RLZZ76_293 [Candidatus Parcubacteria bacterium]|jgi:uncharacterized protein (UPF0335 family)